MASTTKQKTIHYKNAFITGGHVLQDVLELAIGPKSAASKPKQRQQQPNPDSTAVIFVNRLEKYNGITFGQLITLEAGSAQRFITLDDDADFYSIDTMTSDKIPAGAESAAESEKLATKRREFLESVLYFGVFGNHVVMLQSAALRSNHLEAHLSWLLGTHTKTIPNGTMLDLKDKAAEETFERLKNAPVKKISIGAPLTSQPILDPSDTPAPLPTTPPPQQEISTEATRVRFTPHGAGAAMLLAALKDGFFDRLNLDDSLDDSNIHVSLEVTYLRKTTKAGHRVLDSIATSLRHLPESDLRIELEGGGHITGDQLKLSGSIAVEFLPNGLVNEGLLFDSMQKWLLSKVSSNEIDPLATS